MISILGSVLSSPGEHHQCRKGHNDCFVQGTVGGKNHPFNQGDTFNSFGTAYEIRL